MMKVWTKSEEYYRETTKFLNPLILTDKITLSQGREFVMDQQFSFTFNEFYRFVKLLEGAEKWRWNYQTKAWVRVNLKIKELPSEIPRKLIFLQFLDHF